MNETILRQARANGGVVTSSWGRKKGIPSVYLSRLVASGQLYRAARGIYVIDPNMVLDPWYVLQRHNPTCVYSYSSALYLLGETDLIPSPPEVTVYSGYNARHILDEAIIHYVRREIHKLGVIKTETSLGFTVYCYDFERTVCDLIANQNKVDAEMFTSTMQRYAKHPVRDIRKLIRYAGIMGIKERARFIMELLQ